MFLSEIFREVSEMFPILLEQDLTLSFRHKDTSPLLGNLKRELRAQ